MNKKRGSIKSFFDFKSINYIQMILILKTTAVYHLANVI